MSMGVLLGLSSLLPEISYHLRWLRRVLFLSPLRVVSINSVPFMYCNLLNPFFRTRGASCKSNISSFTVDITASNGHFNAILINKEQDCNEAFTCQETSSGSSSLHPPSNNICFRISIFQQIPGTLLVRGNLQQKDSPVSGAFSLTFQRLREVLKNKFGRKRPM